MLKVSEALLSFGFLTVAATISLFPSSFFTDKPSPILKHTCQFAEKNMMICNEQPTRNLHFHTILTRNGKIALFDEMAVF